MFKKKPDSMTFWEHANELRRRIIVSLLFVVAASVGGYFIYPLFVRLLLETVGEQLYAFDIAEGFLVRLQIALSIGLFVSLPVLVFQIVLFVIPALKAREKKILFAFLAGSFVLFLGGMAFALRSVLPVSVQFLKSAEFFPDNVGRFISFRDFLGFFMVVLLGFGVCFQFPIVILLLLKFNIVPFRFFIKNFKYVVILIFTVAAVITPPDVTSQIMLALPMLALYALCLLLAKLTGLAKTKEGRD